MTGKSDSYEQQVLDATTQGNSLTGPGLLYVALHTSDPTDAPDGSTEVSNADYSRPETIAGGDWTRSGSTVTNAIQISFGTASSEWGVVTHVSLWDGPSTGDEMVYSGELTSSELISSGRSVFFDAGVLSIEED